MSKWGLKNSPACGYGYTNQTIHHIVVDCPKKKFSRGFKEIHETKNDALEWIQGLKPNHIFSTTRFKY